MLRTALIYHFPSIANQFEPHFDWLIELNTQLNLDARTIITWRVYQRIDLLNQGENCFGELIKPHRAYYLELNQTKILSENRGIVKPIIKGNLTIIEQNKQHLDLNINWLDIQQRLIINCKNNLITCLQNNQNNQTF